MSKNLFQKFLRNMRKAASPSRPAQDELFRGHDGMFKKALATARVYGEYGCGASTLWVARNTDCRILSVDTSAEWVAGVSEQLRGNGRATLHYVDVGDIAKWGWPESYDKLENFPDYTDWFWKREEKPDTVLIDGRFRVCCFLSSLYYAAEGTTIIFDDYVKRRHYHYVERFLKPRETNERQARFSVPDKKSLDLILLERSIKQFRFVFD